MQVRDKKVLEYLLEAFDISQERMFVVRSWTGRLTMQKKYDNLPVFIVSAYCYNAARGAINLPPFNFSLPFLWIDNR